MNLDRLIARMEYTPQAIAALVRNLTDEEFRYKPAFGAWSICEILCHLADEETDDFRLRLKLMMEDPAAPWPKNDPEGWAVQRNYNAQDPHAALARFSKERAATIAWLRSLKDPSWNTAYLHPNFGPVHAGVLMVGWPAHDALHIRQIAKRLFELAERDGLPEGFGTKYAGEWKA